MSSDMLCIVADVSLHGVTVKRSTQRSALCVKPLQHPRRPRPLIVIAGANSPKSVSNRNSAQPSVSLLGTVYRTSFGLTSLLLECAVHAFSHGPGLCENEHIWFARSLFKASC